MSTATLGYRVSVSRSKRKMMQEELASRVGVSRTQISNIERNETETSVETLRKLSKALKVSSDYLLGLDKNP